jgi:hypothetical protein
MNNEKIILNITPLELIEKLNKNEQETIDDYTNFRIQVTGMITSTARPMGNIIRYDEFGNLIDNIQKSSIIIFGNEEWGWEIFFYFDEIVVDDLHIGDFITIQGDLETVERHQTLITESITENERRYRDIMFVDFKNCIIIKRGA